MECDLQLGCLAQGVKMGRLWEGRARSNSGEAASQISKINGHLAARNGTKIEATKIAQPI
jgi:hypothetical protein